MTCTHSFPSCNTIHKIWIPWIWKFNLCLVMRTMGMPDCFLFFVYVYIWYASIFMHTSAPSVVTISSVLIDSLFWLPTKPQLQQQIISTIFVYSFLFNKYNYLPIQPYNSPVDPTRFKLTQFSKSSDRGMKVCVLSIIMHFLVGSVSGCITNILTPGLTIQSKM